ncbi:hypothetical protein, partial [Yersinia alsatica]|uniref:hypothetical protein n=1 Tax=Yersinia alsatica TaxID=2890317 RepID=UPI0011A3C381
MLTEFHFDEFYLACDELNGDNANFVHGKIIDLWKDYGCLIYPHSKKREYLEWLGESDPRITNLWKIAFSHFRSCDMGGVYKPINECKNPNEVEIGCTSDNIDLVLVPNDTVI